MTHTPGTHTTTSAKAKCTGLGKAETCNAMCKAKHGKHNEAKYEAQWLTVIRMLANRLGSVQ